MSKIRCSWASNDTLNQSYHDNEWGVPLYNEQRLFEFLILEGAQAGLSWITILRKRENYRIAFEGFKPERIACYDTNKIDSLLQDAGIVRNRLKVEAAVTNAKKLLEVRAESGDFSTFMWQFVAGKPKQNLWRSVSDIPSSTPESVAMSKELKKRGFKFVGPTICYALMQATGMVNDHTKDCFRHKELQ